MTAVTTCPVCGGATDPPFISIAAQPVHCNVLWKTKEGATGSPRGDLDLVFCPSCSHIHNASFDESLTTYGGAYENSLHHSAVFQEYASDLVQSLVERRGLRNCDIVEIGAGQGDFLTMLCEAGGNRGTGFDPSHIGTETVADGIELVSEFYGERFAAYPADLIVCRHVLEHIGQPGEFVKMIRRVIGDRSTTAFFEVPNAMWTVTDGGIWDLIYEHCGYFTPTSLAEVFRRSGFHLERSETVFGNQFLTIEASPTPTIEEAPTTLADEVAALAVEVDRFTAIYRAEVDRWNEAFEAMRASGRRGVIWGAGSKGVTFLNTVDTGGVVERAVDINPRKRGMHIAGSGQRIVQPAQLADDPPDTVFVMNRNYRREIEKILEGLGVSATIQTV